MPILPARSRITLLGKQKNHSEAELGEAKWRNKREKDVYKD
jgi:hypothetical protein